MFKHIKHVQCTFEAAGKSFAIIFLFRGIVYSLFLFFLFPFEIYLIWKTNQIESQLFHPQIKRNKKADRGGKWQRNDLRHRRVKYILLNVFKLRFMLKFCNIIKTFITQTKEWNGSNQRASLRLQSNNLRIAANFFSSVTLHSKVQKMRCSWVTRFSSISNASACRLMK